MRITETATFILAFDCKLSKGKASGKLQKFLKDNEWLDSNLKKKAPLHSYHSDDTGICEITLADLVSTEDFTNQIQDLFDELTGNEEVKWIQTLFNKNTEFLVCTHADKNLKNQLVDISDVKEGDKIVIYMKPTTI